MSDFSLFHLAALGAAAYGLQALLRRHWPLQNFLFSSSSSSARVPNVPSETTPSSEQRPSLTTTRTPLLASEGESDEEGGRGGEEEAPRTPPHEADAPLRMEEDAGRLLEREGVNTREESSRGMTTRDHGDEDEDLIRPRSPARYETIDAGGAMTSAAMYRSDVTAPGAEIERAIPSDSSNNEQEPSIALFSSFIESQGPNEASSTPPMPWPATEEIDTGDVAEVEAFASLLGRENDQRRIVSGLTSPSSPLKSNHEELGSSATSSGVDSAGSPAPLDAMDESLSLANDREETMASTSTARSGPREAQDQQGENDTVIIDRIRFESVAPRASAFSYEGPSSMTAHAWAAATRQDRPPQQEKHSVAESLVAQDASMGNWSGLTRKNIEIERSATLKSNTSERRMASLDLGSEGERRSMEEPTAPLAMKIDVIAGPCSNKTYVTPDNATEIVVGRGLGVDFALHDPEISSRHTLLSWSAKNKCWQVCDLGSLNGTILNAELIGGGSMGRQRGEEFRLSADDVLQLGSSTKMKISLFPREMLPENFLERRSLSLSVGGSLPRSLTMPKHRIPSFSSLLSPKITSNSPSKRAVIAAASDELRLECCIAFAVGTEHIRRGQRCEDVAVAECPLRKSELVLNGAPAALFCVFDGHCGRNAADAACTALPEEISDRVERICQPSSQSPESAILRRAERTTTLRTDDISSMASEYIPSHTAAEESRSAFREAFLAADKRIASEEGCTATAVLAWLGDDHDVRIQAANVGDSAALLIDLESGTNHFVPLTEDHRLTNSSERERLERAGIPLTGSTHRLYGLNLSRALGDRFLKDEDLGLIADPYVSDVSEISEGKGALLLIASDGLWDVLARDRVASLLRAADEEHDGSVVDIASSMIEAAQKANTRDDVTALVVRVFPADEWALRSPIRNVMDFEESNSWSMD